MSKAINKKEIDRKINRIHKSTKTRFLRFEKIHQTLRKKSHIYYSWHNLPHVNLAHYLVLVISIFFFVNFLVGALELYRLSKINQGFVYFHATSFKSEEFSSLVKSEKGIVLAQTGGSFSSIGSVSKTAVAPREVNWQKVEYKAIIPEESKISIRIKNADDPKSEWSDYYKINDNGGSFLIPQIKSKSIQTDIIFEGKSKSPELNSLNLIFSYPQELTPLQKKVGKFLQKYLPIIWKKIDSHYGNTIEM